jgi:hypothetical protein
MFNTQTIAQGHTDLGYDRTLTFVGVLRRFFTEKNMFGEEIGISKRWNDNTCVAFIRDYENRLIPIMDEKFGAEKSLHTYTEDDFESILEGLSDKHHYSDSTLLHYRHLLWVVYRAGFEHGLYDDNIFWEDNFDPEEADEEKRESQRIDLMTRIRKSFSIDEEIRILRWFQELDPTTVSGENIGLLFMFFEGIRNNEACGANFSSVHMLSDDLQIPVFDMLQSTKIDSNEVKSGGKTSNAPRVLPMIEHFYYFIQERRCFLEKMVQTGELVLPDHITTVEQLPIVCHHNSYTVRASTRDLTKAGRELFTTIGIDKSELAALHQILYSRDFKDTQIIEKEPTTYLFRRNCATHLYNLGYSLPEIQYWIGHDVEDAFLTRNTFSDIDILYNMGRRLDDHPYYVLLGKAHPSDVVSSDHPSRQKAAIESDSFSVDAQKDFSKFLLRIDAFEPNQPVSISIHSDIPFKATICSSSPAVDYPHIAVTKGQQKSAYRKHIKSTENS